MLTEKKREFRVKVKELPEESEQVKKKNVQKVETQDKTQKRQS